jgi:hypothetical protein
MQFTIFKTIFMFLGVAIMNSRLSVHFVFQKHTYLLLMKDCQSCRHIHLSGKHKNNVSVEATSRNQSPK